MRCCPSRAKARTQFPHPARGEEPVRPPTDEIGVLEMTGAGLRKSRTLRAFFFLRARSGQPGTAVLPDRGQPPAAGGNQALVAPTLGTPRRAVVGWDQSRLDGAGRARSPLRRAAVRHDVYLNVAGGLRIQEPAADLTRRGPRLARQRAAARRCRLPFREISLSAPCVRSHRSRPGQRGPAKLGFTAPSCRRPRAEGTGESALTIEPVASLASPVADIAARGSGRRSLRSVGQQDG